MSQVSLQEVEVSTVDDMPRDGTDYTLGFDESEYSDFILVIKIIDGDDGTESCASDAHSQEAGSNSSDPRIVELHVCSLILAGKSDFFKRLFSDVKEKDANEQRVDLHIPETEEVPLMELLKYAYSGTVEVKSAFQLLNVLKVANKFQMVQCIDRCLRLLNKQAKDDDWVFPYLEYQSNLGGNVEVQELNDGIKKFIQERYRKIDEDREFILDMPLVGIEMILASDVMEVLSEDLVLELALEWTEKHYAEPEEQKKVFSENLCKCIRYPYLSIEKLRDALKCQLISEKLAYEAVNKALFYKVSATLQYPAAESVSFPRRAYKQRTVTALDFTLPSKEGTVYFEINLQECLVQKPIRYDTFNCNGLALRISAECSGGPSEEGLMFSVRLVQDHAVDVPPRLDYHLSEWKNEARDYNVLSFGVVEFNEEGTLILFDAPWPDVYGGGRFDITDGVIFFMLKLIFN